MYTRFYSSVSYNTDLLLVYGFSPSKNYLTLVAESLFGPTERSKTKLSFGESLFLSLSLSTEAPELVDILDALLFNVVKFILAGAGFGCSI